jgi:TP901-1 family phage major tail protein
MSKNGSDLLILVNTGTPSVPTYSVVGCQRDASIERTAAEIDVSCKDGADYRGLPGRRKSTLTLDKLYVPTDDDYQALEAAYQNGELILIARQESGVVTATADAFVTSLSESFPDQDAAIVAISMTVDGGWVQAGS